MLYTQQVQNPIFSQTMALNLSILKMNKVNLNILLSELTDKNPIVAVDNIYIPWKDHFTTKTSNIFEDVIATEKKLFDNLREELLLELDESDYPALYLLIGNLSPNGFLITSSQKLCQGINFDVERVEKIRLLIMNSSYLGLASLDSAEYLLFMTRYFYTVDSLEYRVSEVLTKYSNKNITIDKLAKHIDVDKILLQEALQNIKKIAKSPLVENNIKPIYPDFLITVQDNKLIITPSSFLTPSLSIKDYQENSYTIKELKLFLKEANTIKEALHLRMESLQRHAEALILARSDFFLEKNHQNDEYNKEVKLKDIAKITGRHISTVSRALKDRYFIFNEQIFPFSILWNRKIGIADTYTVKNIIKKIIENENNTTPLSDTMITDILYKKGIKIARRTVNKYRQELKINSSYQR
ncbi:MAG: hypothetical protein KFW21_01650 [Spirochaetota bacterium]|nr:hypothetical protein [Spirochaetota bacterium]